MRKDFFIINERSRHSISIRNYSHDDIEDLIRIQREAFPPPFPKELLFQPDHILQHIERFPQGALCVEVDHQLAGSLTCLVVNLKYGQKHTWKEITDSGYIRNHQPGGNTLYVVDLCVSPAFRGFGIGKELLRAAYETVVHLDLDRLAGGGRMPGYSKVAHQMTAEDYFQKIKYGDCHDPVITFLLKCGRVPVELLPNYIEDEESLNWAVLMEWKNPFKHL
ncbi:GNAT family N-acetyltransferase [Jeotgalibacillus sp. S-D1]|uniref:GNAT family N-acetyltransferase n=1 Tax=Jeotgalibacillus sp. S-D1 TaxID=2552189 RepID=UPI0010597D32|nr:GNAT family N-acetyltransferase [Jeotgalibacillus sp. S-D1]TDL35221.1 GNAT family N-acetyltransferase [Jeotgalibacillus sp. S-D1]